MKKIFSTALLAAAVTASASAVAARASEGEGKTGRDKAAAAQTREAANASQQKKNGVDCSPQRAGVRCNRPKPRKPWFFGK